MPDLDLAAIEARAKERPQGHHHVLALIAALREAQERADAYQMQDEEGREVAAIALREVLEGNARLVVGLHEAQERERVLRDALERYVEFTEVTMGDGLYEGMTFDMADAALEQARQALAQKGA